MNLNLMGKLDIPCATNGAANAWAVADHTVLLMLALYRRLVPADRAVREGRWKLMGDGLDQVSLYDLHEDPGEVHDLHVERHDIFSHLADVRNRWAESLRQDPTVIRELDL